MGPPELEQGSSRAREKGIRSKDSTGALRALRVEAEVEGEEAGVEGPPSGGDGPRDADSGRPHLDGRAAAQGREARRLHPPDPAWRDHVKSSDHRSRSFRRNTNERLSLNAAPV